MSVRRVLRAKGFFVPVIRQAANTDRRADCSVPRADKGTSARTNCSSNRTSDRSACHAAHSSPTQRCLGAIAGI